MQHNTALGRATPLPTSTAAHLAHRKLKSKRTLNDLVEDVHLLLVEDEKYIAFLDAVFDEQAVEGSLAADNLEAAHMIREKAVKMGSDIGKEKKATIAKSLGIVLRRYEWSRKERRNTVDGEVVRNETENGEG
jgi:hypothetical protein